MSETTPDIILTGHTNDVNSCDYSANGLLVTSSSDKTVRVWSRKSAEDGFMEVAYSPLTYHKYSVHCVRFSPSGTSFVSCSTDGTAVVWNAKTGVTASTLRHPSQCPLRTCCFSPDGALVATAGDDGHVCVWSGDDSALLLKLRGHEETVTCVAFSPDGGLLVSGALDGDLRMWQPRSGQSAGGTHTPAHDLGVTGCDFMPRSAAHAGGADVLASCGTDCAVRLWKVVLFAGLQPLTSLAAHSGAVMAVRFSADGSLLASAAGDKTVRLWKTSTWRAADMLHGHQRYVTCCCFSPDGRHLVSGSNDKTVRVWPALAGGPAPTGAGSTAPALTPTAPALQPPQAGDWSCQEVASWLRSLGLAQYAAGFTEQQVDGARLLQLTEPQLETDLAVELVGHRSKLLRQIERLRLGAQTGSAPSPPPDEFYCPITREVMREAVVCSDGYSYEHSAIAAWLRERTSSPMTNEPLAEVVLVPNHALRSLIGQWRASHSQ